MNQITFIADGKNKDFFFTFPFFIKSNVIVKVNHEAASGYGLFCVQNTSNSDVPFSGGRIHFAKAPKAGDIITIYRKLEKNRIVDYQITAPYNPVALNQDINYLVELIKDMQADLDNFTTQYSEITDKEKIDVVLERINVVMSAIDDVTEMISDLGDVSEIQTDIENLEDSIDTLDTSVQSLDDSVSTLNTFKNNIFDYVIETQSPSAANNYTWYRKYKSGWIEQGGSVAYGIGTSGTVTLPVAMSDNKYTIVSNTENDAANNYFRIANKTTTTFNWYKSSTYMAGDWIVTGFCAQ